TTAPSFTIALTVFLIVGFSIESAPSAERIDMMQGIIASKFNFTWWLFLIPLAVVVLLIKKVPAIPSLFAGSLMGGIFAVIFQPELISTMITEGYSYAEGSLGVIINTMALETVVETPDAEVTKLLTGKGMNGMLNTVWLIICALTFGGVMQATGMLTAITNAILKLIFNTGSLIFGTAFTCVVLNVLASDQYLAIVVPGKMFEKAYRDRGLAPENLSRVLEDSGTVTSVLVPWNTCGVAQSSVLGVSVETFAIYCVFNYTSFFMTVLFGLMGWKITKAAPMVGSGGTIGYE
ncbi:MAG: Na+/H+ antiporter NhaC family protein, partial [Flavobacteriales bacterium]